MKIVHIKEKLKELGVEVDQISLGRFDEIGEFCAKKKRDPNDPNYSKVGAFFRPNYERGILLYYLIRLTGAKKILEIGHGRGYSTFCAAMALHDSGISDGKITTVDVKFDQNLLQGLSQILPQEWFKLVQFVQGPSSEMIPKLEGNFDIVIIDGDHSYEGTKKDWEAVSNRFNKLVIFDDYHLPSKEDPGIQCRKAIDEIDYQSFDCDEPTLTKLDRRIFIDDRGYTDDQIDYGQVILNKKGIFDDQW